VKRLDDNAVSELMGYTVLVAVVSLAAIGLLTGGMGTLSAAEKQMEFTGSVASLGSYADIVSMAVETNNTFFTAHEMSVPQSYDLIVRDAHDDFRSIGIYENDTQLAFVQLGSVRLRSPFRTVTFEGGGGVISNDTGLTTGELSPSIHTIDIGKGKQALYISVVSVSADSFVTHSGPVTLYVRCSSVSPMVWHLHSATATLRISSGDREAWIGQLEKCGFSVGYEDGAIKATNKEVSDIYVTYAVVEVKKDGQ